MEGRVQRIEDDLRKLKEELKEEKRAKELERLQVQELKKVVTEEVRLKEELIEELERLKDVHRQKEVERMKEIEKRLTTLEDSLHRTINVVMPKLNAFLSKQEGASLSGVPFPIPSPAVGATATSPIITLENNTPNASNTDPMFISNTSNISTSCTATSNDSTLALEPFPLGVASEEEGFAHTPSTPSHSSVQSTVFHCSSSIPAILSNNSTPSLCVTNDAPESASTIDSVVTQNDISLPTSVNSIPSHMACVTQCNTTMVSQYDGSTTTPDISSSASDSGFEDTTVRSAPFRTPFETIFDAAKMGDLSAVERFLLEGCSVQDRNKDGDSVLHVAATHGHIDVVKVLLDADAKVDVPGPRMRSALHCAVTHGHLDIARLLLDAGAEVDNMDVDDDTPLHVVARDGNSDLASVLVENGCSIVSLNKKRKSPLELALEARHWSVVRVLLEKGDSSVECVSRLGIFKLAVENNCDTIVKLLLYRGLSNVSREGDGSFLLRAIKRKYWKIAKILLDWGSLCNINGFSDTPLCLAAELGHEGTVSLLLEKGVTIDEEDDDGETALTRAIRAERWGIVELLLNKGASATEHGGRGGDSPLSAAARGGHLDLVRRLLRLGDASDAEHVGSALNVAKSAAVVWTLLDGFPQDSLRGDAGTEAVECAAEEGRLEALVALLQAGVPCGSALTSASCNLECVQVLLDMGADINAEFDGHYALCYAARRGHEEVVRELLRRGAGENVEQVNCAVTEVCDVPSDADDEILCDDADGTHLAGALVALLDAGADVNAKGENEQTALHSAAWNESLHCVRVLLTRGANVNAIDGNGDTALHKAALECRAACVRALLAAGADRQIRNKNNETPRDIAATEEIRMFLEAFHSVPIH